MKRICSIFIVASLILSFSTGVALSQKSGIEKSRNIIDQMDEVAGTFSRAPKNEESKKPAIEKIKNAIAILYRVQKEKGFSYDTSFLLARAYAMLYNMDVPESFDLTVKHCQGAIQTAPDKQDAYYFLAIFYSNSGHPNEAMQFYWKALWTGSGEKPAIGVLRGMVMTYFAQGDGLWTYKTAKEYLKYYSGQSPVNALMTTAQRMVDETLLNAVTIHFKREAVEYSNNLLEYSFKIPNGWRIAQKESNYKNLPLLSEVTILGLPYILDDQGVETENGLSIVAMRMKDSTAAEEFATNSLITNKQKFSKILSEGQGWLIYESTHQGVTYKGRMEAKSIRRHCLHAQFYRNSWNLRQKYQ